MKRTKLLSLIATACLMVGCNKNDDNTTKPNGIDGKWNLVKITSPMDGNSEDFSKGSIVWTFSKSIQMIYIQDTRQNVPQHVGFDLPKNGSYGYTVKVWESICDQKLSFDNRDFGCIELNGDALQLSTAAIDGPIYRFTR